MIPFELGLDVLTEHILEHRTVEPLEGDLAESNEIQAAHTVSLATVLIARARETVSSSVLESEKLIRIAPPRCSGVTSIISNTRWPFARALEEQALPAETLKPRSMSIRTITSAGRAVETVMI